MASLLTLVVLCILVPPSLAQSSCSSTLTPTNSIKPAVASGYRAALVATGLSNPRSIQFDTAGNLLVVESGTGSVTALTLTDNGGTCVSVSGKTTVIDNKQLNHGLALSSNGSVLYASSTEAASSWQYDASKKAATNNQTLVSGMITDDHTTRTLLMSEKVPEMLLVSRGSTSNEDMAAATLASGHSQIRAFNLTNMTATPYDYDTEGLRLGWGLRNSVGVAEHPVTGGIYSVENSVDQMTRDGKDIHEDNPGEEMNFHGYLNGTEYAPQGANYGYPWCYAAWVVSDIPDNSNLTTGSQFAIDPFEGQSRNDTYCAQQVQPRLTFQAHMAPLDMKFNSSGDEGWVTFHGSWDRTDPAGYKVSLIQFQDGEPVDAANSMNASSDIFYNANNSVCPNNCFRPVGMAFDKQGRLFVASDASGKIYVVVRDESSNGTFGSSATGTSPGGSQPSAKSVASQVFSNVKGMVSVVAIGISLIW